MTQFLIRCFIKHPEDTASPAVRTAYGNLASVVGMACNLLLCLGKLAAGTLFGSIAIMADALNNLSDASSNLVSLVGFRLAAKAPDEKPRPCTVRVPGRTGGQCHHSGHRVFSAERIGCAALPAGCHGIQLGIGGGAGCFHRRKALAQRLLPQGGRHHPL